MTATINTNYLMHLHSLESHDRVAVYIHGVFISEYRTHPIYRTYNASSGAALRKSAIFQEYLL